MNATNATQCPPESMLSEFGLGKLDAASAETISRHLETCADCRQRVAGISGDSFVGRLKQAGSPDRTAAKRERTYVPGESLANAANSTDGSSLKEDGPPGPSRKSSHAKREGLGSPSFIIAPPELTNHADYELVKELGQGGMGTVYLAKNRMMDRMEVLKVISTALLSRPGALERFQQEIRSAAKLAHSNIVAAYSVLRPGHLLVFAMEYVRGQDLSQVVKQRGPLPVANAAFYIHQVALGLQHAFEKGMVHRDIKPNNLMLAIEGKKHTVKILDFGLAKASSEKGAETGLTKSGQMLGTPDYVAPEQTLDAHNADIRADIYSLGCTLYFLLSGGPPFQETSLYAILEAHHKRDPKPLNLVRPDVPVELATVVAKMMAKEPAKRYQTPVEVAKALVPFFKPGQATLTPRPTDTGPSQPASEGREETAAARPDSPTAVPSAAVPVPMAPDPIADAAPAPLPAAESETPFGVSIDTHRPAVRRRRRWSSLAPTRPAAPTVKPPQPGSPWRPGRNMWLAGGGGALLLLLLAGVVFFLPTKNGLIRVEINDPQIEVAIKGTEIVLKQADNGHDVKVSAGEKTLVVERGDFKFETDKLILKKGEIVTVAVTLSAGQVKVKQGDKLLGQAKLPAAWHGWPADAPQPAIAPFSAAQAKKHQQAWADYLKLPVEHTNSLGMKFVLIPPGEYTMGSTAAEIEQTLKDAGEDKHWQKCIRSEAPQHEVVLTRPFYLAVHEVTQKEYEAVMGNNPSYCAKTGPEAQFVEKVAGLDTAKHPVENVSWNDAAEFCAKLSKQEELKPFYFRGGETVTPLKGSGYRLPSEAEWEFACRAGTTTKFSSGDRDEDLMRLGWFWTNSGGRTHEVEELARNPFGLFDMHGNVCERVEDSWQPTFYERFGQNRAIDPKCLFSAGSQRVLRGGRFNSPASFCRSPYRNANGPSDRYADIGFRVMLPVAAVKSSLSKQPDSHTAGWHGWPADAPKPAIAPFSAKQAKQHQQDWADYLKLPVEHTNSLGMKFVLIPPGEFTMGSTDAQVEAAINAAIQSGDSQWAPARIRNRECPQHKVVLTKPLAMSATEVTVGQFRRFIEATKHATLADQFGGDSDSTDQNKPGYKDRTWRAPLFAVTDDSPVTQVSWIDAAAFCNWLCQQEKFEPSYREDARDGWVLVAGAIGYRLPSEAEWEFACRAGTRAQYSFGDDPAELAEYGWYDQNSTGCARAVGLKLANPFGLYDMHGNVWELCGDLMDDNWYVVSPINDPKGPRAGGGHAARGGCWYGNASACRSALRCDSQATAFRGNCLGFRVSLPVAAVKSVLSKQREDGAVVPAAGKTASGVGTDRAAAGGAESGFIPLFNGKDLTGWEPQPGERTDAWVVADGALTNQVGGRIFTENSYANFILRFEFQVSPDTAAAIDILSFPKDTPLWVFLDNTRNAMGAITFDALEQGFSVHRLNPPAELRPDGQWNEMTIELNDSILKVSLNERDLGTANIKEHMDRRRPNLPPAERQSGRIALHKCWGTGTVSLRNLSIKELSVAMRCSFRNETPSEVAFSLGNKSYRLGSQDTQEFMGSFSANTTPVVLISQPDGSQTEYTVTDGGEYTFRSDPATGHIVNHYR